MFYKCIKDVGTITGQEFFQKDEMYYSYNYNETTGHEVRDEQCVPHIIGQKGEEWFDEHFRGLSDEEYKDYVIEGAERFNEAKFYDEMIEAYKDMPDYEEVEAIATQESVSKQIENVVAPYKAFYEYFRELYGQGLEVANWHMNDEMEPFDDFFEAAERDGWG